MSDTQTGLARCYRHPMRETGVRCVRCDRPICPDCMRPASVGFMCPDDVRLGAATVRRPRTAVGAPVAGSVTPYVTYTLIAINVAMFVATFLSTNAGLAHQQTGGLQNSLLLVPPRVFVYHEYYRIITSAFQHFNLLHLASNMLALFVVGPPLEHLLGRWRFLAVYLLAALGGSVAVLLFGQYLQFVGGASGAIFGLFGAALLLNRQLGIRVSWVLTVLVINIAFTFAVPSISIEGHFGGLVVGALAGVAIGGLPTATPHRLPTRWQGIGLAALFVVLVVLVGVGQVVRS